MSASSKNGEELSVETTYTLFNFNKCVKHIKIDNCILLLIIK